MNTDEAREAAMRVIREELPTISNTTEAILIVSALAEAGRLAEVDEDPKKSEASYLNLIEAARHRFEALLSAQATEDDIYHVALDALDVLRDQIANNDFQPWRQYT